MKHIGFLSAKTKTNKTKYWISCYNKDDEDEPYSVNRIEIEFSKGENKEKKMLMYCHDIFKSDPGVWEILVHQGPDKTPATGDLVVARLSREPFRDSEELVI
jgi:hypothetical protein